MLDQTVYNNLVLAVNTIHNPASTSTQRREAQEYCDNFKDQCTNPFEYGTYMVSPEQGHLDTIRHFGLHCMEYFVKYKWSDIKDPQFLFQAQQSVLNMCQTGIRPVSEPGYIKEKAVRVLTEISKRTFPQQWRTMVTDLMVMSRVGGSQSEMVFLFYRTLLEDVMVDGACVLPPQRRKELRASLMEISNELLQFTQAEIVAMKSALESQSSARDVSHATAVLRSALSLLNIAFSVFGPKFVLQLEFVPLLATFLRSNPIFTELRPLVMEGFYALTVITTQIPYATNKTQGEAQYLLAEARLDTTAVKFQLLDAAIEYRTSFLALQSTDDDEDYRYFIISVQWVCALMEKVILEAFSPEKDAQSTNNTSSGIGTGLATNRVVIATKSPAQTAAVDALRQQRHRAMEVYGLYLELLTIFITHPSVVVGTYAASTIKMALSTPALVQNAPEFKGYDLLLAALPSVLQGVVMLAMKSDGPDTSASADTPVAVYLLMDFDDVNAFSAFHSTARSNALQLAQAMATIAPVEAFELLIGYLSELANEIAALDASTVQMPEVPLENRRKWEALSVIFGKTVTGMLEARTKLLSEKQDSPIRATAIATIENSIQNSYPALVAFAPRVHSMMAAHLNTLSSYLPYLAINPSHLMSYIDMLFSHLLKPAVNTVGNQSAVGGRPKTVDGVFDVEEVGQLLVRRSACKYFIRACKDTNGQMLSLAEECVRKVDSMWSNQLLSWGERGLLIEGLFLVSNHITDSAQQSEFLNQVAGDTINRWTTNELTRGVASAASFVSYIGIDALDPSEDALTHRETMIGCVKVIYGASMRLTTPHRPPTHMAQARAQAIGSTSTPQDVFAPVLLAVLPNLLSMIRCVHELWTVQGRTHIHPQLHGVLEMSKEEAALRLGGFLSNNAEKRRGSKDTDNNAQITFKTGIDSVRNFLDNMRDNSYLALKYMLGRAVFYTIPDISGILLETVFNGMDQMQLKHVRFVTKNVVHTLVDNCPAQHHRTILSSLLPGYISFITQLLDEQWSEFMRRVPDLRAGGGLEGGLPNDRDSTRGTENEEVLVLQMLTDATTETMDVWAVLMRNDKGGGIPNSNLTKTDLDALEAFIKDADSIREPLIALVYKALGWRFHDGASKAIRAALTLTPPALQAHGRDATYYTALTQCALQGLIMHGSQQNVQKLVLDLINMLYRKARVTFCAANCDTVTSLQTNPVGLVLASLPTVTDDALRKYDTAVMNDQKKDQTSGIQKLLGKEIGKNVGDLFKKNTSILNLTPSEYLASINKRNVPGDTDDPALDTTDLFS